MFAWYCVYICIRTGSKGNSWKFSFELFPPFNLWAVINYLRSSYFESTIFHFNRRWCNYTMVVWQYILYEQISKQHLIHIGILEEEFVFFLLEIEKRFFFFIYSFDHVAESLSHLSYFFHCVMQTKEWIFYLVLQTPWLWNRIVFVYGFLLMETHVQCEN